MEPILRRGAVVPSFTLPDAEGWPVQRAQYRGRQHLLLVFLPSAADEGAAPTYERWPASMGRSVRRAVRCWRSCA